LLSYTTPQKGEKEMTNKAIDHNPRNKKQYINNKIFLNNIYNPQDESTIFNNPNTSIPRHIKTSLISYENKGPVESNTWNEEALLWT